MKENKVVMAGAGVMGASLAQVYALAGYDTYVYDIVEAGLEKGKHLIAINQEMMVKEGLITAEESKAAMDRMTFTLDKECFRDCCLVVESTVERMDIKQNFFAEISEIAPGGSTAGHQLLRSEDHGNRQGLQAPRAVHGQHWLNPPHLLPLSRSSPASKPVRRTSRRCGSWWRVWASSPVVVADINGFIINRIQFAVLREALHIVDIGAATIEDVDTVLKAGMGLRYAALGPFGVADFGGLDTFDHTTAISTPS